jgi:penicillin-binding protein 1C
MRGICTGSQSDHAARRRRGYPSSVGSADTSSRKGRGAVDSYRRLTLALIALVAIETALVGLDAAFPPDLSKAYRSSPVALDRRGAWLRALPVDQGRWRIRADLDRTDPTFLTRVVALEDGRFYLHPGVDPISTLRAAVSAALHGRITSGASTLTMQTARLLEPRRRTFGAKLYQMARALQLQARLSKRETLALYLTLAPYGGNLEGVRAASLAYFGHGARDAHNERAGAADRPAAVAEARRPDRHPAKAREARDRVLQRMVRAGLIPEADGAGGLGRAAARPPTVPVAGLAGRRSGSPRRADAPASVVTTLDADLQRRLEPLAAAVAKAQGPDAEVGDPGGRGQDPRGPRLGRLGRPHRRRRLDRHDPRPALARLGAEAVHLRPGASTTASSPPTRSARRRAAPLRRLPAGGLRPGVPRPGDRCARR